jgi:hypothetical protein
MDFARLYLVLAVILVSSTHEHATETGDFGSFSSVGDRLGFVARIFQCLL